jgi:uncharacterized phiE125 gp8 family phage protein
MGIVLTPVTGLGGGGTGIVVEPAIEPVTLEELKTALMQNSGTLADNSTLYTSIAAGSHGVTTGYTLLGTAVSVLGHASVCYLSPLSVGAGGTVDVRISECDTISGTYAPWASSTFTQITSANCTVRQELAYTGSKAYIRLEAKTLVAACVFGCEVMVWEPVTTEDDELNELITDGRLAVEHDIGRKICTQTWNYCPKSWPCTDRIKIPFGNLQSVVSIKWKDVDGIETTLVEDTDYVVEKNSTQCGFVVLPYQGSWPSGELFPSNPITIQFVCGYGSTYTSIPRNIKQAVKRWCVNNYMNRGDDVIGVNTVNYDKTYDRHISLIGRLHDMDFDFK